MVKLGDILEWEALNKTCRGVVVRHDNGWLVCRLPDGRVMPLKDLRFSKSVRKVE